MHSGPNARKNGQKCALLPNLTLAKKLVPTKLIFSISLYISPFQSVSPFSFSLYHSSFLSLSIPLFIPPSFFSFHIPPCLQNNILAQQHATSATGLCRTLQFTFVEPLSHSVQESSKWEAFIASITNCSKYMHIINSSRHTTMILFQTESHYGWQFQ